MRAIEYARLRRRGVRNAWRLTKWDWNDTLVFWLACSAVGWCAGSWVVERDAQQTRHIADLNHLIEMHREVTAAHETVIVTLLNGGTVKADTDVVTCRVRDAAGVRAWR